MCLVCPEEFIFTKSTKFVLFLARIISVIWLINMQRQNSTICKPANRREAESRAALEIQSEVAKKLLIALPSVVPCWSRSLQKKGSWALWMFLWLLLSNGEQEFWVCLLRGVVFSFLLTGWASQCIKDPSLYGEFKSDRNLRDAFWMLENKQNSHIHNISSKQILFFIHACY